MGVHTSAGTKLFIAVPGESRPATTGDMTEVGSITDLGEFGAEFEEVTFSELGSRNVLKFKGTRNDGSLELQLGRDVNDAGQIMMQDALDGVDQDEDFWFGVLLNDAGPEADRTLVTFEAKVMSYRTAVNDPNSITGATANIGIQSGTIEEGTNTV